VYSAVDVWVKESFNKGATARNKKKISAGEEEKPEVGGGLREKDLS